MSADNYVGVWFNGENWLVQSNLIASDSVHVRNDLVKMFEKAEKFSTKKEALDYASDKDGDLESEYGVCEIMTSWCPTCGQKVEGAG